MMGEYFIHIGILICIYIILSTSLNLALGYTGLLNLGHIAFFGIGAYTSALLMKSGVPFFAAFLLAGVIASIAGFLLVYAVRKLKGDYLALATLGFSFVVTSLMLNWKGLTNGPMGISAIKRPEIFGMVIKSKLAYLGLVGAIMILSVYIMYGVVRSPFGRLLAATRDDEVGLRVLGKNTFSLKIKAMMISAFFAGIAGSLFAHYIRYIDPSTFSIHEIILVLTIVIVGGIATLKGSIVASFVIVLIPELLRFLSMPSSILGPLRQMSYAAILLLILLFRPRGIFGRIDLE